MRICYGGVDPVLLVIAILFDESLQAIGSP